MHVRIVFSSIFLPGESRRRAPVVSHDRPGRRASCRSVECARSRHFRSAPEIAEKCHATTRGVEAGTVARHSTPCRRREEVATHRFSTLRLSTRATRSGRVDHRSDDRRARLGSWPPPDGRRAWHERRCGSPLGPIARTPPRRRDGLQACERRRAQEWPSKSRKIRVGCLWSATDCGLNHNPRGEP